jgi:hypothetical protein
MTSHPILNNPAAGVSGSRSLSRLLLTFAAVFLLCVAPVFGQLVGKGAIQGTVTDSTGASIPGATVVITNIATNTKQTMVSTGSGDYAASLDPGKYSITVSLAGFKTFIQQNVTIDALQSFAVNAILQTGDVNESVTVTDAPPQLEVSNATLGVTMEQEMYSALPIIQDGGGQRRATDFASLLPGVSANVSNGGLTTNAGSVNGGGSRGAVSSIYINGVPITSVAGEGDPRFVWTSMAVDAIDQFQVQTVGYSAIYEGQGVQNYIVKRGTNKIHGVFYDYFRNTALDTWGFLAPSVLSPLTGKAVKPTEHQNEYGLFVGFPIIKDKLFVFGGYEGYRYSRLVPQQQQTIPTALMRQGVFTELGNNIYDPNTTTYCLTCGTGGVAAYTRTQFRGMYNGVNTANVIPTARLSKVAGNLQSFLPDAIPGSTTNNYVTNYKTGLSNWTTTNRVDYSLSEKHTMSAVVAFGRQATTAPSAVTVTSGSTSNGLPAPYISSQQFSPKTKVLLFEDIYTIRPNLVNQFKYGYGRYDGPGYNQDTGNGFGAAANGIQGLPAGQASDSFPTVTFSGNSNINRWAGYSSNRPVASGYVLLDNLQWTKGAHSITFGGEIAWLQYNYLVNATGVNPLQLTFSNTTTAGYNGTTTASTTTGQAYASFLIGATSAASFTQSSVPETGGRFRPISPYVQDNWKVTSKLTLDLGLRYDYYPTYKEVQNRFSFLDPNKLNTAVGINGALSFGGTNGGKDACNCRQPVNDRLKNFGPRVGFAFSPDSKTVFRGSWAMVFTHGNANGGSATSRQGSGLQGFSVSPSPTYASPGVGAVGNTYYQLDNPYPAYTLPPTFDATLGTYNTTNLTAGAQTPSYADPYYGGRAPEFINYSFGFQRELTKDMTMTISYVGSQAHFLQPDSLTGRGKWANQIDPVYLSLGNSLSLPTSGTAGKAALAAVGKGLPYASFGGVGNPNVGQALKPFAQYNSVSDPYGFVGNSSFNALEAYLQQRLSHGLTFMTNYTWARTIDNNGTFRSGYDIPAAYATDGKPHAARSLDRSLSLGDQRHKFVITGAYDLPFGKGELGGKHYITRALLGNYRISTIFVAYSGAPVAVTMNSCNTNPSQSACEPVLNPNYHGNGKKNAVLPFTAANLSKQQFLDPTAFVKTPDYQFSTLARTAALPGLFQPPNYKLDLSFRRSFGIPTGGLHEGTRLVLEADMFNVTNHTHFVYSASNAPLTSWAGPTLATLGQTGATAFSTSYGQLGVDASAPTNRAVQLAARFEF